MVKLSWAEPSNSEFAGVDITWTPADGTPATPLTMPRGTAQPVTISGLTNDTAYTFTAKTVDTFGNQSEGVSVTVTPTAGILPDTTAPGDVSNLQAAAGNAEVVLTWTDPADSDFAKAVITWTPADGVTQPVEVVNGIQTATISGLTNDTLYTFTVKTVDTSGNISVGASVTATPIVPFVAVTNITGVPSAATARTPLTLTGTVDPVNATNQTITWSVTNAGTTEATISGNTLNTKYGGNITVTATILDGLAPGTPYTENFIIFVDALPIVLARIAGNMVPLSAGTFQMGDNSIYVATPAHNVTLSAFKINKYTVTVWEFNTVMRGNGNNNENYPSNAVSWYEAIAFCNKLSIAAGLQPVYSVDGISDWAGLAYSSIPMSSNADWDKATMTKSNNGYRLPTEAEWEYACRAGTTTQWYTGDAADAALDAAAWHTGTTSWGPPRAVGQLVPNDWDLYDMHGNVSEWCWDYEGNYAAGPQTDPTGPLTGSYRMNRGGDSQSSQANIRSAARTYNLMSGHTAYIGFRVVRN